MLWHVLEVVGPALALDVAVALGLALCVGEDVGLGLTLGLDVVLPVPLGVALPVAVVVLLALAVPVLAEDAVLLVAAAVAELACAAFDELALAGAHGEGVVAAACPPDVPPSAVPPPNPVPPPLVLVEPDAELCEPASPTAWPMPWRMGGTAASITPTANTAKPTARAGRSMASRQSRGRCACRGRSGLAWRAPGAVGPWRSAYQPRPRAAFQRHTRSASTLTAAATPRASRNLAARA